MKPILINDELHRRLKLRCVQDGISITAFIEPPIATALGDEAPSASAFKEETQAEIDAEWAKRCAESGLSKPKKKKTVKPRG